MQCERCLKKTDIIKHVRIKNKRKGIDEDWMICVNCYNDAPKFYVKQIEEIRNG